MTEKDIIALFTRVNREIFYSLCIAELEYKENLRLEAVYVEYTD